MSKKILIIEDDLAIREVLEEILVVEGFEVQTAVNGDEALTALARGDLPSLIFLDLMMPVKDGFAFRREQRVHREWSRIPVVVLSASANLEKKMAEFGEQLPYLTKPVDIEIVVATARRYCLKEQAIT
jgi:DNA-binding response OmpR family regulator